MEDAMNETGLPGPLGSAFRGLWQKTLSSGREIDQEFVRRGFVSVQAQIDFQNRVFGPRSYEIFLETQTDPTRFERYRDHVNETFSSLAAAEGSPAGVPERAFSEVLADPDLGSGKWSLLGRFFPDKLDQLMLPHMSALEAARMEEQRRICKLYSEPGMRLFDDESMGLRKEACNAVLADAYGALGFVMFKRKRGVDVYCKPLTPSHAVVIEFDPVLFERHYSGWRRSSVQRPTMPLDRVCYLGSPRKGDKTRWVTFLPINNCIAASMGRSYDDTRSLEVAIRADALWYELTIAPFEQAVREHGPS